MDGSARRIGNRGFLLTALWLSLISTSASGQTGAVYDDLSFKSKILKGERKYAIYLPPGYDTSQRSYPVLYLLHGAGGDHRSWVHFGEVLRLADKVIRSGDATAMIIAMPDAQTGHRGYRNRPEVDWRYEDFFFEEFVPHVETAFRVRAEKRHRAVAGLSMGGGGSFRYALHRPGMFSSACPLSASTGARSLEALRETIARRAVENPEILDTPDSLVVAFYRQQSVLYMVENLPEEELRSVRWYIDCGDDDHLYEGNSLVHLPLC